MVIKVVAKKKKAVAGRDIKIIEFGRRTKIKTIDKRFGRTYSKGLTGLRSKGKKKFRLTLIKRKKPLKKGKVF
jgi:hypothetical protein|tara:strand:- start:18 stop:236 length:219 start_codon:yes stop_codon:yes gene_type:complete